MLIGRELQAATVELWNRFMPANVRFPVFGHDCTTVELLRNRPQELLNQIDYDFKIFWKFVCRQFFSKSTPLCLRGWIGVKQSGERRRSIFGDVSISAFKSLLYCLLKLRPFETVIATKKIDVIKIFHPTVSQIQLNHCLVLFSYGTFQCICFDFWLFIA